MKPLHKTLAILTALALFVLLLVPILKGVAIGLATILLALIIAGSFVAGVLLMAALTSPLWVPFVMGWAAVYLCKMYIPKKDITPTPSTINK